MLWMVNYSQGYSFPVRHTNIGKDRGTDGMLERPEKIFPWSFALGHRGVWRLQKILTINNSS